MTTPAPRSQPKNSVAQRLTDRADAHNRMAVGSGDQHVGFYSTWDAQLMQDAADRIEELETALREIVIDPPSTLDEPDQDCEVIRKMREIARAALQRDGA